jgi:hypothetical protein
MSQLLPRRTKEGEGMTGRDMIGKDIQEVLPGGPSRVVINMEGEAVPPHRAREEYRIRPDVIYIREDGWSLGAPDILRAIAFELWADEWVGVVSRPDTIIQAIGKGPSA